MENRLGKGLEALIPEDTGKAKEKIETLSLSEIIPNQFQPRKRFETDAIVISRNWTQEAFCRFGVFQC